MVQLFCHSQQWQLPVHHVRTKASSLSLVLMVSRVQGYLGPGGGTTRGCSRLETPIIKSTVTNEG